MQIQAINAKSEVKSDEHVRVQTQMGDNVPEFAGSKQGDGVCIMLLGEGSSVTRTELNTKTKVELSKQAC